MLDNVLFFDQNDVVKDKVVDIEVESKNTFD